MLVAVGAIAAYLIYENRRTTRSFPGTLAPVSPAQLPPIDPQNPAKNDTIRPKAWTYDPLRIGYTQRWNAKTVKGDYRMERRISDTAADRATGLHKNQTVQDIFVQQQGAYINDEQILDNHFWAKGVRPHSLIRSGGRPGYSRVPAYATSPYAPL